MPYMSSIERLAEQKGYEKGLRRGYLISIAVTLKVMFGPAGARLMPKIRTLHDVERLRTILDAIPEAESLDEIRQKLA